MPSKEQIFARLKKDLVEAFELDEDAVVPEAHLYQDLDIDSIDAIDLSLKLEQVTGRKMTPEELREVRTVQDVVDVIENALAGKSVS